MRATLQRLHAVSPRGAFGYVCMAQDLVSRRPRQGVMAGWPWGMAARGAAQMRGGCRGAAVARAPRRGEAAAGVSAFGSGVSHGWPSSGPWR